MKGARPKQLPFVFADSPRGSKGAGASDESEARAFLLHIAKGTSETDLAVSGSNTGELMERLVSDSNLATALLNVARNKGAPGADGCSVEEVVEAAPRLLMKLRRALLDGAAGANPEGGKAGRVSHVGNPDNLRPGMPAGVAQSAGTDLRAELSPE